MSEKGSELRSRAEKEEFFRTANEFAEKLEHDPYQPGIVHPNLCGDDIQDIVEDVLWIRDFSEMTLHVKKDTNGLTISVEVKERIK